METEDPVHQRLNRVLNELTNGNQSELARRIGVRTGVIGDIFGKRQNKPSFDLLIKIGEAFPYLRMEWLVLGRGEMLASELNSDVQQENLLYKKADYIVADDKKTFFIESKYSEPKAYAVGEGENRGALLYNLRTAASYLGNGLSQERAEPDGIITMPNWLLKSGEHAVFPVIGDSMEPTFYAKDYVVCRFMPPTDWEHFRTDNVAVIVSETRGLQLKRLAVRPSEHLVRCKSDNRQHPSYNLDFDEVLEIWRFEWRITANATNVTQSFEDRLSRIEDDNHDLRNLVEQMMDLRELRRLESLRK